MTKPAIVLEALLSVRKQVGSLTRDELAETVRLIAFVFDFGPKASDAAAREALESGRLAQLLKAVFGVQRRRKSIDIDEWIAFANAIGNKIHRHDMTLAEALRAHKSELEAQNIHVSIEMLEKKHERLGLFR